MRCFAFATAIAVLLSGCATPPPTAGYAAMTTPELWRHHQTVSAPYDLAVIEAELGYRGETANGSDYVGELTSSGVGTRSYARTLPVTNDMNCGDFPSPAAAQRFFLANGGPLQDRHGLDRDGDGMACDWGRTLKRNATKARPKPVVTSSRTYSSSRCYVGPRGGTYTITASGRKNYGGC